jgi:hypothetical protein
MWEEEEQDVGATRDDRGRSSVCVLSVVGGSIMTCIFIFLTVFFSFSYCILL